jgi:hypothetical protein
MRRPRSLADCLVRSLAVTGLLFTAGVCRAQHRDPYQDAFAAAAALERRGDLAGAARHLEAILPGYPQDYDLILRIAWLHCSAGDREAAERAFRAALRTGGAPREAQFGLSQCAPRRTPQLTAALGLGGQAFRDASGQRFALSVAPGLRLLLSGRAVLSATYRLRQFLPLGQLTGAPLQSLHRQHEAYLDLGYTRPRYGVTARYALLAEETGRWSLSHHAGLSLRVSPFGDGLLNVTGSLYPGLVLLRAEPSWRFPLPLGFAIHPGVAYQWESAAGRSLLSAFCTLSLTRRRFSLFLGGKGGPELRPAALDLQFVANYGQEIIGGAWAGAALHLPRGHHLRLSWAVDLLRPDGALPAGLAGLGQAHTLALGVARDF